jgi:hypothetical protein
VLKNVPDFISCVQNLCFKNPREEDELWRRRISVRAYFSSGVHDDDCDIKIKINSILVQTPYALPLLLPIQQH